MPGEEDAQPHPKLTTPTSVYLPFSGTVRGPPLSPWQVSVSFDQAHNLIFELVVPNAPLHFESEPASTFTIVSFKPHCCGCFGRGSLGPYPMVPPHPEMVEAVPL